MSKMTPDCTNARGVQICAVSKNHSISEVEAMLQRFPQIKIIAENRWPDCEEKFRHFQNLQRHFIGPLQSNKVRKVLTICDLVQSVDSLKLLEKMNNVASELGKTVQFCFQVNISDDPNKQGISPEQLPSIIQEYQERQFRNLEWVGLMTIGAQSALEERREYFRQFKKLFDQVCPELPILSMGMSEDYQIAIEEGATMVRIGRALF